MFFLGSANLAIKNNSSLVRALVKAYFSLKRLLIFYTCSYEAGPSTGTNNEHVSFSTNFLQRFLARIKTPF
jgi:hypothetical protein